MWVKLVKFELESGIARHHAHQTTHYESPEFIHSGHDFEALQNDVATGHFEKNQQKLSKNKSDDAHICTIWTKYFMFILSILKFGVFAFFERLKKLHSGRIS